MATQSFHPFRSEQAKAEYEAVYTEMAKAWPVPFENLVVDTASARTFVRASGRPTDPPLVLLSGTRGTSLMWAHMVAALSARHRVYAVDNVNDVGLSVPKREAWPADALVDWLDEVFRVLVPEGPLDLLGMSYGGWLAGLYALRFPQRVRKVALLAPGGIVLRFSFGFFMRVMAILAIRVPGASEDTFRRVLRWVFEDAFRGSEACRRYVQGDVTWMLKAGRYFVLPKLAWPTSPRRRRVAAVERAVPVPGRRAREDLLSSGGAEAAAPCRPARRGGDRPGRGARPDVRPAGPRRSQGARVPGQADRPGRRLSSTAANSPSSPLADSGLVRPRRQGRSLIVQVFR